MEKNYYKLVRDKIPEIIQKNGDTAITRILNNEEYIIELNKKLKEEVNEYLQDNNEEELADIVEVIYAILDSKDITIQEFEDLRNNKANKRGVFKEKFFLEKTL